MSASTSKIFDTQYVPHPHGLVNTGVLCYLNSFLQSLLTCPSVTEFFFKHEAKFQDPPNDVALEYMKLLRASQAVDRPGAVLTPVGVFRAIILSIRKKDPHHQFGSGQEDSGEAIMMFLEAINIPMLDKLFMYHYNIPTYCGNCKTIVGSSSDKSCFLVIPKKLSGFYSTTDSEPLFTSNALNKHIYQHISMLDDYKCPQCSNTNAFRIYQLSKAPSILIVNLSDKFFIKSNIPFPDQLEFPTSGDTCKRYKLVSKIEHAGGPSGGHYWAHSLRRSTTDHTLGMANLNDTTVSPGNILPSPNSYILFYHRVDDFDDTLDGAADKFKPGPPPVHQAVGGTIDLKELEDMQPNQDDQEFQAYKEYKEYKEYNDGGYDEFGDKSDEPFVDAVIDPDAPTVLDETNDPDGIEELGGLVASIQL
jgi:uncharacterized UBP type Zn finger protein